MNVSLITSLFGKPDKKDEGKLIYVLDNKCDKGMDNNPDYLYRKDIVFLYSKETEIIEDVTIDKPSSKY